MSTRLHIVVSEGLRDRIDGALGSGQSRGDFVRRAVEQALESRRGPGLAEAAKGLASEREMNTDAPAPAEQAEKEPEALGEAAADVAEYREILDADPGDSPRSVREFRPYPKGG